MTIKTLKDLQGLDIEAVAKAVEAHEGHAIPGLRQSLAELKAGKFAAIHTPEQLAQRKASSPRDSAKE